MSWEAWGSGLDPFDLDLLYKHGWESNSTCDKWWKVGEEETVFTMEQAIQAYTEWMYND